jgi:hypothetical protein
MNSTRVDRILAELGSRYRLSDSFLQRLRPLTERIFSNDVPIHRRPPLLEELAATCQRDLEFRGACRSLQRSLAGLLHSLNHIQQQLREIVPHDR